MENVAVVDQPKWPALDAVGTPAIMSFKMIWKATDEKILYDDPQKQFRVEGYRATAQLEAQVKVPSIDFSWKSDPLSESHANFAIIGDEINGRYYNPNHRLFSATQCFFTRSHDAVIRVYDEACNVIETHEHKGDFKGW